MNEQEKLVEILRHKGIGPEGSKSLDASALALLDHIFKNENTSLTTRATLLTALLTLPPTEKEKTWLDQLHENPAKYLPETLLPFVSETDDEFQTLINTVIRQEDIEEKALVAIQHCFDPQVPAYKKASFLEAMRLKRETYTENRIFYQYFQSKSKQEQTSLPLIVDLCDSYDGVVRHHNYGVFTAAILAAMGIPTLLHGLKEVAPKKGFTHAQILAASGKSAVDKLEKAHKQLADPNVGWAYVDQSVYFPELYDFISLREEMVKRPFIATFEKLLQPIRALNGNFIVSAYTHKHYRMEVIELLKETGNVQQAIHYKGIEATTQPNPSRAFDYLRLQKNTISEQQIDPNDYGLAGKGPILHKEGININDIIRLGEGVLKGEKNEAYRFIIFQCAIILENLNWDKASILPQIEAVIASGKAANCWQNGHLA